MFGGFFDLETKRNRLNDLEMQIESMPNFWNQPEISTPVLREKKAIETLIEKDAQLLAMLNDLDAAIELAGSGDDEYKDEAESTLSLLTSSLRSLETQCLLNGEADMNPAILSINAGAGGTESCDWASILLRMYLRYAERKGWQVEEFDLQSGEAAGIKSVTIQITGDFAYGFLKAESGVHRLVRISPFDSNARRHTSFASVYVTPVIDDKIEIQLNPADIEVDTYRSSGAGGQHVNKTDSAVRMKHIPTGIVVSCQTQRSQIQNREQCLKLLRSALYEREMEMRRAKRDEAENAKSDIGFGHQIRSYVLHPYKLVKDHRTEFESHAPDDVLDGNIDPFIDEFLAAQANKGLKS